MKNLQIQNKFTSIGLSFFSGFILVLAFFIYVYNFPLPEIPREYFIYNALLEEVLKFIVALVLIFRFKLDPLYIAFVGAGFGFGEGLSHFYFPNGTASLYPLWMHIGGGLIMSYFFWRAYNTSGLRKILNYSFAILGPVIYHGIYNEYVVQLLGRDWLYILFG